MRVIVTRAYDDGLRTAARLAAAGHEAILAPVIAIVGTGAALPEAPVDAILATSEHALTGVTQLPPALAGAGWLCVGNRVAAALAARGWGSPEAVAVDVGGLVAAIDARFPEPFRFLYLAGRDRKPDLEHALLVRGHSVLTVETYRADLVAALPDHAVTALLEQRVDAALHFSRRSASLFVACSDRAGLSDAVSALRHVAISPDAAAPLREAGWACTVAATPDEAAMLAALGDQP